MHLLKLLWKLFNDIARKSQPSMAHLKPILCIKENNFLLKIQNTFLNIYKVNLFVNYEILILRLKLTQILFMRNKEHIQHRQAFMCCLPIAFINVIYIYITLYVFWHYSSFQDISYFVRINYQITLADKKGDWSFLENIYAKSIKTYNLKNEINLYINTLVITYLFSLSGFGLCHIKDRRLDRRRLSKTQRRHTYIFTL